MPIILFEYLRARGRLKYAYRPLAANKGIVTVRWLLLSLALVVLGAQSQEASHDKSVAKKAEASERKQETAKRPSATGDASKSKPIRATSKQAAQDTDEKLRIDRQIAEYTRQLASYTDDLSRYTLWLVIVTIVLGAIGVGQGFFLKRTVDLGREEFISTHRPRLLVRRISINFVKGRGVADLLGVQFLVDNIGDTPGRIVEQGARIWLPDSTENLPPIPEYGESTYPGLTIASGESAPLVHYGSPDDLNRFALRLGWANAGGKDEGDVLFLGYVDYEDALKRKRRTAFLRRYDFATQRFDPIDHPDYEYQD